MIDRLGDIDPINNVPKTRSSRQVGGTTPSDSINVSPEAKELAEAYFAMEAAGSAPDVRSDRVAEVLQKMKDPSYINNSVVDLVADRLMDVYGL